MPTIRLDGCRTEPLGSYLKSLGILRLVCEQLDPAATGWWEGDRFCLGTAVSEDELLEFFLIRYEPTPIVTPWNGGSGFRAKPGKTSQAVNLLAAIAASATPRLSQYRVTIETARATVEASSWEPTKSKSTKSQKAKECFVTLCRAQLPDATIAWLDAAIVLTDSGAKYPWLLGTGGNDGNNEFSKNFMECVAEIIEVKDHGVNPSLSSRSDTWLRAAFLADPASDLLDKPIGQFDPGHAGGLNAGPKKKTKPLTNPWDYILLIEGALLFASGSARRMAAGSASATAMPFMVRSTAVGYPTGAADEGSKGEIWVPLWRSPAGVDEVQRLIAEGRTSWNGSQAQTGLDFVRAAASLGVDRGVDSFVRYCFVERHGQNMLAISAGRVDVVERPSVPVLAQFDSWVSRVARAKVRPASVDSMLRELERSQFRLASGTGPGAESARQLQEVLIRLSRLESRVVLSAELRDDKTRRPVTDLKATDWVPLLDDDSPELRLAVGIASQRDSGVRRDSGAGHGDSKYSVSDRSSCYLRAVKAPRRGGSLEWSRLPARVPGLGRRPIEATLSDFLVLRAIDAMSLQSIGSVDGSQNGVRTAFSTSTPARLDDVALLAGGIIDSTRLRDLLQACLLLDFTGFDQRDDLPGSDVDGAVHPALALLAPFFHGRTLSVAGVEVDLRPHPSWPRLLATGTTNGFVAVLDDALMRLRIARLDPAVCSSRALAAGMDPARLVAAVSVPLARSSVRSMIRQTIAASPPSSSNISNQATSIEVQR